TALQESRQPAPTLPLPEKLDIRATRIVPTIKSATKRSLAMQSLTQDQPHLRAMAFARRMIELHDLPTAEHMQRVQTYADCLGEALGLEAAAREHLRVGALLHDVGKISVSEKVLNKPQPLSEQEVELMRNQTLKGAGLLELLPDLEAVLPIIRSHHERWDGTG